jgi:hypothetical protein
MLPLSCVQITNSGFLEQSHSLPPRSSTLTKLPSIPTRILLRYILKTGALGPHLVIKELEIIVPLIVLEFSIASNMHLSAEAIIAIVSLVVATPCTVFAARKFFQRRHQCCQICRMYFTRSRSIGDFPGKLTRDQEAQVQSSQLYTQLHSVQVHYLNAQMDIVIEVGLPLVSHWSPDMSATSI